MDIEDRVKLIKMNEHYGINERMIGTIIDSWEEEDEDNWDDVNDCPYYYWTYRVVWDNGISDDYNEDMLVIYEKPDFETTKDANKYYKENAN